MLLKLKLFLVIICLLFVVTVYYKVITKKLELKHSLIWIFVSVILIFFAIFDDFLTPLQNLLGFEKLSNMIFFFGYIILIFINFSFSITLSKNEKKIVKLTQENALLKKETENVNKKNN